MSTTAETLQQTPLHALHLELGARMVPFAGYSMPVQYPSGVMAEHLHTRQAAGLFDVSHMGQLRLRGADAAAALESLIPMDVIDLPVGKQRYGLLLNEAGGILDDLMFVNRDLAGGGDLFVVVNGACKVADLAHITQHIGQRCEVIPCPELALLALQGPQAVRRDAAPGAGQRTTALHDRRADSRIRHGAGGAPETIEIFATRSGYTGEDGFEISVHQEQASTLARLLLAQPEVKPIGLGARNSLRLEAGLCLYGNDLDTTTTPVEAQLNWAIQKVRRNGGARAGGFPGADIVLAQLDGGASAPSRKRVGLQGARAHSGARTHACCRTPADSRSAKSPAACWRPPSTRRWPWPMCAAIWPCPAPGSTRWCAASRVPMEVVTMPFVPNRYYRG